MEAYNNNISIGFCWGFLRNQLTGSLLTSSKQLRKIFQRPFVFQFSQIKNVYLILMVNILSETDIFINRFYIYLHRYCLMSLYSFFVFHHFIICKTKNLKLNLSIFFFHVNERRVKIMNLHETRSMKWQQKGVAY